MVPAIDLSKLRAMDSEVLTPHGMISKNGFVGTASIGAPYWDAEKQKFQYWDGTQWGDTYSPHPNTKNSAPPENPEMGFSYFDAFAKKRLYWDGAMWSENPVAQGEILLSEKVIVPDNPFPGPTDSVKISIKDAWNEGLKSFYIGQPYVDINSNKVYYWNGKNWDEKNPLGNITHLHKENSNVHMFLGIQPEDEAMLQALYSRSSEPSASHVEKVQNAGSSFLKKFYVGYGHASIGQTASITFYLEGVSMLAAKAVQNSPLYNGQETSSRYVDYSKSSPKLGAFFVNGIPDSLENAIESIRTFYAKLLEELPVYYKQLNPIQEGQNETTYNNAIKAKTFDVARGFLLAGSVTQLSWHTTLDNCRQNLDRLKAHPLREVRQLALEIQELAHQQFPDTFEDPNIPLTGRALEIENFNLEYGFSLNYDENELLAYMDEQKNAETLLTMNSVEFPHTGVEDIAILQSHFMSYSSLECNAVNTGFNDFNKEKSPDEKYSFYFIYYNW